MNISNLTKEQASKELEKLAKEINHHNILYHRDDAPIISDCEYDQLFSRNKQIEEIWPDLIRDDSPSRKVGSIIATGFSKIIHAKPMLSLANAFDKSDMEDFLERIQKDLKINDFDILCELKIDGLSFSARYEDGIFKYATTRGDGLIGEDITNNIKTIKNLPFDISKFNPPKIFEVRGEIYIDKEQFNKINDQRLIDNEIPFANARNAAAGSIRQLDSSVTAKRNLKYFIHGIGELSQEIFYQSDIIKQIKNYGFSVNEHNRIAKNIDQIEEFYNKVNNDRANLAYEIDGVVYKINDIKLQNRLGVVARNPRWAIAYKFKSTTSSTIVDDIIIQVGRIGSLSPVAIFRPVDIGGVTVTRASLHNKNELERKDIRIGDTVVVQRAGDVIPQIVEVDLLKRPKNSEKFIYPNYCPNCNTEAVILDDEVAIRCPNLYCSAQILEQLAHFVSRNAFNIDGLGYKQLKFLLDNNLIKDQADIFLLEENDNNSITKLKNLNRFGEKSTNNLFSSINKAKSITLDRFIYSLGIRYIGENTSKLIAAYCKSINNFVDFIDKDIQQLKSINGIGDKAVDCLVEHFKRIENLELIKKLAKQVDVKDFRNKITNHKLAGKIVVFTGTLVNISRREAKMQAENCGAHVASNISLNCDYLIVGASAGSKLKKAKELNLNIINEDEWISLSKI